MHPMTAYPSSLWMQVVLVEQAKKWEQSVSKKPKFIVTL